MKKKKEKSGSIAFCAVRQNAGINIAERRVCARVCVSQRICLQSVKWILGTSSENEDDVGNELQTREEEKTTLLVVRRADLGGAHGCYLMGGSDSWMRRGKQPCWISQRMSVTPYRSTVKQAVENCVLHWRVTAKRQSHSAAVTATLPPVFLALRAARPENRLIFI